MGSARSNERAAMRSPINWALLGLLIRRPSHGYELLQRFKRAYPGTLELSSPSQIYTALDSLQRRGLIRPSTPESRSADPVRQRKLQYTATPAGIDAYERWLSEQVSEGPQHSQLLAEHVATVGPEYALRVLDHCAELALTAMGAGRSEDERPGALADRLAAEDRRLRAGAVLAWIEYARSELRAVAAKGAPR